jgi:hypothetical protein
MQATRPRHYSLDNAIEPSISNGKRSRGWKVKEEECRGEPLGPKGAAAPSGPIGSTFAKLYYH